VRKIKSLPPKSRKLAESYIDFLVYEEERKKEKA